MAQRQLWKPRGSNCAKCCLPEESLCERCCVARVSFHKRITATILGLCLWDGEPERTGEAAPVIQPPSFHGSHLTILKKKKLTLPERPSRANACIESPTGTPSRGTCDVFYLFIKESCKCICSHASWLGHQPAAHVAIQGKPKGTLLCLRKQGEKGASYKCTFTVVTHSRVFPFL